MAPLTAHRPAILLCALIGTSAGTLPAQAARVHLDLGVSHARPPAGVTAEPVSYVLVGGRADAGPVLATLHGGLAPDPETGSWAAGMLGVRGRARVAAGLEFGVDVSGSAFTMESPTSYRAALGRASPEVRISAGHAHFTMRGHGGVGRSEVGGTIEDLWTYGGGLEVGYGFPRLDLHAAADLYEAIAGSYRAVGLSATGVLERIPWRLEGRIWATPGDDVEWQVNLSISVPLARRWRIEGTGGRNGPDPLLGSPPGANGSLVLTWDVTAPAAPPLPIYTFEGDLGVVFRLDRDDARRVEIVGDFTGWEPLAMERRDGVWQVSLRVAPGVHHFGFLVDGEWHVPREAPGRTADDFGRLNATLVVTGG